MLHHNRGQLDGYFIPIGEDYITIIHPFGDLWEISYSDLPNQLWEHVEERAKDPSIEPLIVQSGKDLLRE